MLNKADIVELLRKNIHTPMVTKADMEDIAEQIIVLVWGETPPEEKEVSNLTVKDLIQELRNRGEFMSVEYDMNQAGYAHAMMLDMDKHLHRLPATILETRDSSFSKVEAPPEPPPTRWDGLVNKKNPNLPELTVKIWFEMMLELGCNTYEFATKKEAVVAFVNKLTDDERSIFMAEAQDRIQRARKMAGLPT